MRRFALLLAAVMALTSAKADELKDANTALGLCLGEQSVALDDGVSDASTIADAVLGACITQSEQAAAVIYERVKNTEGVGFDVFKLRIHSFHKNFVLRAILERRASQRNG
jgi:hypothetical protein